MSKITISKNQGPELVFGLVGAVGSELTFVSNALSDSLKSVGYDSQIIHIIKLLHELDKWKDLPKTPLDDYICAHQDAGDEFRRTTELEDALIRLSLGAIRNIRKEASGENKPLSNCAYILRSLKHPGEVDLLRKIYGSGFFLLSAYSPREKRVHNLAKKIAESHHSSNINSYRPKAEEILVRDEIDISTTYGQNVRDAFPLADVFIDVNSASDAKKAVNRFIELLFGYPFHTPTKDEFAMFHAKSAALRSSDLSHQVGAVIATNDGDILSVGTNEVPKAGGGLYWSDDESDGRDFTLDKDESTEMKLRAFGEIIERLQKSKGWLTSDKENIAVEEYINEIAKIMKGTQFMSVGEFGRTVHAEMAALLDAARRGLPINDEILYTTTFPCHNCAKHILAAGLSKVIYIEPYPKSLARELHFDSIITEKDGKDGKISFLPFVGIAPRKYLDLFSMVNRKDDNGKIIKWKEHDASPRFPGPLAHLTYLQIETAVIYELKDKMREKGIE